jgi:type VI secretion system protein ImpL
MDDFARLFAPGGLIDGFFNTQLRPYVDSSSGGGNWTTHPLNGIPAPVSPADLVQFQRAAVIRDLFFAAGGNTPTVRFDLTPVSLDNGAKQVSLDIGATMVTYAHGPPRAAQITWPGQASASSVRLVFDPPPAAGTAVFQSTGPWALFRLFEKGSVQKTDWADRYILSFSSGERQASFEIRAGSVINPFAPGLLAGFQCPKF